MLRLSAVDVRHQVLKIQDELVEFSGKLEGQAAQQCWVRVCSWEIISYCYS